jgi:hypothetical protein
MIDSTKRFRLVTQRKEKVLTQWPRTITFLLAVFVLNVVWAQPTPSTTKVQKTIPDAATKKSWFTYYNLMHREFAGTLSKLEFGMNPTDLQVTTHSFGVAYALPQSFSVVASSKFLINKIELESHPELQQLPPFARPPSSIRASTEGISDTMIGVQKQWTMPQQARLRLTLGVSLPTGSFEEKTPEGTYVSYPGQLGSGTFDFAPSLVYRWRGSSLDLNARLQGKLRTGRNDLGYRLGDEVMSIVSSSLWLTRWFALTGSLYYRNWKKVVGQEIITSFNNDVQRRNARRKMAALRPGHGSDRGPTGRPQQGRPSDPHHTHGSSLSGSESSGTGRPETPRSGASRFSTTELRKDDPFAASGSRFSAQLGAKMGMSLGPVFRGIVEAGIPVYLRERGELQGLETQWYLITSLSSQF